MQPRLNGAVEEDQLDSIGKRLRWARDQRGLTQGKLEERSGVGQAVISKIEKEKIERPTGLLALARGLRCNANWLDTGDGDWEDAGPTDVGAALSLLSDMLKQRQGVQRATVISALEYFLKHPDEWQQVADQIDASVPKTRPSGGSSRERADDDPKVMNL